MGFISQGISAARHWLASRLGPQTSEQAIRELACWSQTELGRAVLGDQQEKMDDILDCLFGYHLMTMGVFEAPDLCRTSKIQHKFLLASSGYPFSTGGPSVSGTSGVVQASFEQLPLAPESVDVVILHHALDYAENPHKVLREVVKSVIPRGHVIIVGFNPWSVQGICKLFLQWPCKGVWRRHSLRAGRLEDWLRLLDCEPLQHERGFFRLPVNNPWLLEKFRFMETLGTTLRLPWGGYYLLVARKDIVGMTPIKPLWKKYKPTVGGLVAKPSVPNSSHKTSEPVC